MHIHDVHATMLALLGIVMLFTPGQGLAWDTPTWTYALGLLLGEYTGTSRGPFH